MSLPRPDSSFASKVFPSPNHGERVGVLRPDMIVLHYTGMTSGAEALGRLCNPVAEVSCHYFVWEDGGILQLVPEARRAWHAGVASWAGETDLNSRSIGIEIVNPGHEGGAPPFPSEQITAVAELCADLIARHGIAPERVLAHSDIAPARKRDPGEIFPWEVLHARGVGHLVPASPIAGGRFFARGDEGQPVQALQAMFALYGYRIAVTGVYDEATEQVVRAFQRHFRREQVDGVADSSTITTLRDLIAHSPGRRPPLVA
ncbi:MAG: N-acetylmuramoyl-L-alanine amidase [Hyphomicrobiales bacterium]|nr:N-acetylmuramoyl-L-alanine amidase [Hyphomicrobiales bacterium]